MSMHVFQRVAAATASAATSAAVLGAIATNSAQAATLNYTSTVSLFSNNIPGLSLSSGAFNYTKTDIAPKQVNYTLNSANFTVNPFVASGLGLQTSYTRESLITSPKAQKLAKLVVALLPSKYIKYQGLLTSFLTPGAPVTYRGDGDFPPANFSLSFSRRTLEEQAKNRVSASTLSALKLLFSQGGKVTFASTLNSSTAAPANSRIASVPTPLAPAELNILPVEPPSLSLLVSNAQTEAVPEPTTMAGLALAGAGMAIARRKRQKNAA